jgi:hypothetical protein
LRERILLKKLLFEFRAGSKGLEDFAIFFFKIKKKKIFLKLRKRILFEFRAGSKGLEDIASFKLLYCGFSRLKTSLVALTGIHGHRTLKAPHPV